MATPHRPFIRLARLAALPLWLAPRTFRATYLAEFVVSLAAALEAEQAAGRRAVVRLWSGGLIDAGRTAWREHRSVRRRWTGGLGGDVRYVLRSWSRAKTFAATAIVTIGLGIGLSTGIFAFADGFLFRPLPFDEPDRLFDIGMRNDPYGALRSYEYDHLKSAELDFIQFADWSTSSYTHGAVEIDGVWDYLLAFDVSPDFERVMGFSLAAGRRFRPEEHDVVSPLPVWISHRFWQERFNGSTDVLGRRLRRAEHAGDGPEAFEVVGILPPLVASFDHNNAPPELVTPAPPPRPVPVSRRELTLAHPMARLAPGVTPEQAEAQLQARLESLWATEAVDGKGREVRLRPLRDRMVSGGRSLSAALFALALLVMLLVAVNLVHLLLTRAVARSRELVVRRALGASMGRLARLLLTESALLSLAGLAVGLIVGQAFSDVIARSVPEYPTDGRQLALIPTSYSWRAVGFGGFLAAVVAAVGAGVPMLAVLRGRFTKAHIRGTTGDVLPGRVSRAVLSFEVAIVTVVVAAAALVGASAWRHLNQPIGFRIDGRYAVGVEWDESGAAGPASEAELDARVLGALATVPGVERVARGDPPNSGDQPVAIAGRELPRRFALDKAVDATYFDTFEIPVLAGRTFTAGEGAEGAPVAVVDEVVAGVLWPGRSPLGERLQARGRSVEVVGVVRRVARRLLELEPGGFVYLPLAPEDRRRKPIYVATTGIPAGRFAQEVRRAAAALLPQARATVVPLDLEQLFFRQLGEASVQAPVAAAFGLTALMLAAIGLFGVIAYSVERRHREFGIRMALGADRASVWRAVLRQGLAPASLGLAFGLAIAIWSNTFLRSLLRGLEPSDTGVLVSVAGLVLLSSVAASIRPARRAMRVDPTVALSVVDK